MSIRLYKHLVVFAVAGWSAYFAVQQPVTAGGQIVQVTDPIIDNCNDCGHCCGQSFCRKLRLHCIYARRCCSQKYVLLPSAPALAPYVCPPANSGVAQPGMLPAGGPYDQPTIGGYSSPPRVNGPAGVFIR